MAIKSVGIFCAASESIDPRFADEARKVGTLLGNLGIKIIYGGAAAGLMEATAKAARIAGGEVVGVVPEVLIERNRVSKQPTEVVITKNLSDRKDRILADSDILLALPGGIGTLDEVFHVMAASTIGYHSKKVIFYNIDGFWTPLLQVLATMKEKGFARGELSTYFIVANNIEQLRTLLTA